MQSIFKIIGVFPLRNQIELLLKETGEVFYFRFSDNQSVQSQLNVGDFFLVEGNRFQVLKKDKKRGQGLSGALDLSNQLLLFNAE